MLCESIMTKSILENVVKKIFENNHKKILLVDKSIEFDEHILLTLKQLFICAGYDALINNADDSLVETSQFTSIIAHMRNNIEVNIHFIDSNTKPVVIPKDLVIGKNRVLVLVLHTRLKKLPYAKKLFDLFVIINEECENHHVRLTKHMIQNSYKTTDLEDVDIHDLNMLMLILHQNVLKLKLPLHTLNCMYNLLVTSELFDYDEDIPITPTIQVAVLLREFVGGMKLKGLDFTQHLSKYSIQSSNKKKIIEKHYELRYFPYEKLLMSNSPLLSEICISFNESINKFFINC